MIDCPNTELRDLLPDLAAGGEALTPAARASALAHLATCPACREELALLQSVRRAYAQAPAVDVARVAAALPHPSGRRDRGADRHAWQRAAAVVLVAVGVGSLWLVREATETGDRTPTESLGAPIVVGDLQAVTLGDRLSELSEQDLRALLGELDALDALPAEDPAPVIAPLGGGEGS